MDTASTSSMTHTTMGPVRRGRSARNALFSAGLALMCAGGVTACGSGAASTSAAAGSGVTDSAAHSGSVGTSPAGVKAKGGGDFCRQIAASYKAARGSRLDTSPAAMKKLYSSMDTKYRQAVGSAPSAIKGDVETLGAASAKLTAAMAAANYDITKLAAGATAVFSTPKVLAASAHIETFVKYQCGIDLAAAAAASATAAP